MNQNREVIQNTLSRVKIVSKLSNFRGIVVTKGRIHKELMQFMKISLNLIKSENKMILEIVKFDIFGKRTQRGIRGMKNHRIRI